MFLEMALLAFTCDIFHTHACMHAHAHTRTNSSNTGIHKRKQGSTPYIQYGPNKRQKSVHCKPVTSEWFTQQTYTKTFKHHQMSVGINNTVCAKILMDCFQTNKSTLSTTVQTNIMGLDETTPFCTKHGPKPCPRKCIWWGSPGTVWSGMWNWALCSELGNLLLQLFSTVGSMDTVTLFPTTAEGASCKVHQLLCIGWLPTTIIPVVLVVAVLQNTWDEHNTDIWPPPINPHRW